ncbi:MAG TPA: LysR substrate-binding domain-containing protein [Planctomycetota bacterium]|jgi:DNA-binding transcriptional LysR family regulator|nr:LysR substrate-binding domain-containing protein [Planctomycetota bacterium]
MELRHCRYFVAVAEELHFGRAAKRLNISQPPLSQQIRALEKELGVELLRRTKRNVRLTSAGEVFLQATRKLLRGIEDSMEVTRRAARGEVGTLQVGYAPGAEIEVLPRVLREFSRLYPAVDVRLVPLPTREQLDALRQRRVDVGFVLLPAPMDDLEVLRVRREPMVLVAPKGHPLARKPRISIRDLEGVPYIHLARSYEPMLHDHILGLTRDARVSLRVVAESAHLYDNLSLVAAGVGVSLLPGCVRLVRRDGVVARPIQARGSDIEVGLAWRRKEVAQVPLEFIRVVRDAVARPR